MAGDRRKIRNEAIVTASAAGSMLTREYIEVGIGVAATTLLPRIVALAIPVIALAMKKRTDTWLQKMIAECGDDPGAAKEVFYQKVMTNERAAAAIVANYNALLEAEDPAVVPTLAALGIFYAKNLGPTIFFRSYCRVLKELSAPMFEVFRRLFGLIVSADWTNGPPLVSVEVVPVGDRTVLRRVMGEHVTQVGAVENNDLGDLPVNSIDDAMLIFRLLKREGLDEAGRWGSEEPDKLLMDVVQAHEIHRFLREPS